MNGAPDSTEVDPDGHRVVFENERVRILEVRVAGGRQLPLHSHPARSVVAIGSYRLRSTDADGTVSVIDRWPGGASWSDGEVHAATVLIGPVHAIEVEVKTTA